MGMCRQHNAPGIHGNCSGAIRGQPASGFYRNDHVPAIRRASKPAKVRMERIRGIYRDRLGRKLPRKQISNRERAKVYLRPAFRTPLNCERELSLPSIFCGVFLFPFFFDLCRFLFFRSILR
jgi:hypothetical protein